MESQTQGPGSLEGDEEWASRGQATEHQLRRFSSQTANNDCAAEDGTESKEPMRNGALMSLSADAPALVPASSSLLAVVRPSSKRLRCAPTANENGRPAFADTTAPSLRTLNDGLASLEREFLSARLDDATVASATRLSSAPVSRGAAGPLLNTKAGAERLQPLHSGPNSCDVSASPPQNVGPLPPPPPSLSSPLLTATPCARGFVVPTARSLEEPPRHPLLQPSPTPHSSLSEPVKASGTAATATTAVVAAPAALAEAVSALPTDAEGVGGRRVGPVARPHRSSRLAPVAEGGKSPARVAGDGAQPRPRVRAAPVAKAEPTPQSSESPSGAAPAGSTPKGRDGRIKVVVRKRPFNPGEDGVNCVEVSAPHLVLSMIKQRVDLTEYTESSDYAFDDTFDETVSNEQVYVSCVPELLDVALQGGSASVFAYGQTGSGKTYTMMGDVSVTEGGAGEKGLYLLGASELFRRVTASQHLLVSFYEIYCNSLFDLLNNRSPVVLREDGNRKVNICGLSWHSITSAEELWGIVKAGLEQRRTGSTSANERSSRSHAIMSIRIKDTGNDDFEGTLNFVDLAGSERGADTANNDRLTRLEGAEINKSLLALKECIRSLDEKKRHVPFRGSRLTEVLRDSFTGNSKTVMIANVSPSSVNYEHTANTLRYAFRVKGLSVASVVPSKARNAPRPFQLGVPPRSRSTAGASPPNAQPQGAEEDEGGLTGDEHRKAVGNATPQRRRPRRRRSTSQSRERRSRSQSPSFLAKGGVSPEEEGGEGGHLLAERRLTEPREKHFHSPGRNPLVSRPSDTSAFAGRRPAPYPSGGGGHRSDVPSHESGEASLVSLVLDEYSVPPSLTTPGAPLPTIGRSLQSATAAPSISPDSGRTSPSRSAASVAAAAKRRRAQPRADGEDDEDGVFVTRAELQAMEARLKAKIMRQLQRDLGKEIKHILDERDGLIASLRAENSMLRVTVERLQTEHSATSGRPVRRSNEEESGENQESDNDRDRLGIQKAASPGWLDL